MSYFTKMKNENSSAWSCRRIGTAAFAVAERHVRSQSGQRFSVQEQLHPQQHHNDGTLYIYARFRSKV